MRTGPAGLLVAVAVAAAVASPAPAGASCAMTRGSLRDRLATAETVFVGRVTGAASAGRFVTVDVESVWRGEVADEARVRGGETAPGTISSVDRGFDVGRRYLFVPYDVRRGIHLDNACTDTRPWRPRLERLRPPSAVPVGAAPSPQPSPTLDTVTDVEPPDTRDRAPVGWVAAGFGALVALGFAGAALRRRRGGHGGA